MFMGKAQWTRSRARSSMLASGRKVAIPLKGASAGLEPKKVGVGAMI